jgi:hypothetical protein
METNPFFQLGDEAYIVYQPALLVCLIFSVVSMFMQMLIQNSSAKIIYVGLNETYTIYNLIKIQLFNLFQLDTINLSLIFNFIVSLFYSLIYIHAYSLTYNYLTFIQPPFVLACLFTTIKCCKSNVHV